MKKTTETATGRCFVEKGVLRNFTKFTGKHLCQSLFFNKVAGLRRATLLKKRLWHRCFPVNFVKFLRTPFLQNTSGRLLLKLVQNTDDFSYYASATLRIRLLNDTKKVLFQMKVKNGVLL